MEEKPRSGTAKEQSTEQTDIETEEQGTTVEALESTHPDSGPNTPQETQAPQQDLEGQNEGRREDNQAEDEAQADSRPVLIDIAKINQFLKECYNDLNSSLLGYMRSMSYRKQQFFMSENAEAVEDFKPKLSNFEAKVIKLWAGMIQIEEQRAFFEEINNRICPGEAQGGSGEIQLDESRGAFEAILAKLIEMKNDPIWQSPQRVN